MSEPASPEVRSPYRVPCWLFGAFIAAWIGLSQLWATHPITARYGHDASYQVFILQFAFLPVLFALGTALGLALAPRIRSRRSVALLYSGGLVLGLANIAVSFAVASQTEAAKLELAEGLRRKARQQHVEERLRTVTPGDPTRPYGLDLYGVSYERDASQYRAAEIPDDCDVMPCDSRDSATSEDVSKAAARRIVNTYIAIPMVEWNTHFTNIAGADRCVRIQCPLGGDVVLVERSVDLAALIFPDGGTFYLRHPAGDNQRDE